MAGEFYLGAVGSTKELTPAAPKTDKARHAEAFRKAAAGVVPNPGAKGPVGLQRSVYTPGGPQPPRYTPIQAAQPLPEPPRGGAPAPKQAPGSAKVIPFPNAQSTPTQETPPKPPSPGMFRFLRAGARRLGILGAAIEGVEADKARQNRAVGETVQKFGLNPKSGADISAARAYVWAKSFGWLNLPAMDRPDQANHELHAQAIMDYERQHPGTLAAAVGGSYEATKALNDAVASADRRGVGTGPLSTTYERTSTAMRLSQVDQCKDMPGQRHHEIPAELMEKHADFLNKIGYSLDYGLSRPNARAPHSGEPEAIIRLPTNEAERAAMSAVPGCGDRTIHNGSHSEYAKAVDEQLQKIKDRFNRGQLNREQARAAVGRLLDGTRNLLQSGQFPHVNDAALARAIRNLAL